MEKKTNKIAGDNLREDCRFLALVIYELGGSQRVIEAAKKVVDRLGESVEYAEYKLGLVIGRRLGDTRPEPRFVSSDPNLFPPQSGETRPRGGLRYYE